MCLSLIKMNVTNILVDSMVETSRLEHWQKEYTGKIQF